MKLTKKQILENIDQVKKWIEEGEDVEEIKWKPKEDEIYYYINASGSIEKTTLDDYDVDKRLISIGNYSQTREEALSKRDKLKAIERVKWYIVDNFGYDPENWADWENEDQEKYSFYLDCEDENLEYDWYVNIKEFSPIGYLKSFKDCDNLIKNCEDDLLLIFK